MWTLLRQIYSTIFHLYEQENSDSLLPHGFAYGDRPAGKDQDRYSRGSHYHCRKGAHAALPSLGDLR